MKRMLMLVPLAIFLLIAVFLYKGLFLNPSDIGSTMIGKPLPEFSLASLETPERKVTVADFQELPALLNVWATWCPTCKAEHAMLNKLAAQGVVVYGVNYKDDSDAARQWLAQLGNPYRFSVEDPEGSLGINLGVYGAPETFVIDRKGIVRDKFVGAIDERIWRERLAPLYQSLVDEQ
ncbi:DsbE family thiol:disulfide interchange protein [Stutzerimonas nitrititolerans]|uniref:DsbE family thiol:disulfide interchange protein n=1 Tax=Stutzerimonas nitrititolerans TaxID=2482751 RepID=A0AA41WQ27_9GAMM|nr:DsbE family thiol:disulfide interchange protein [Stutzerimonas nitrititolerans]KRW73962.1 thiol:disulfide interchange protein [Pseudomonas sp. TTU2014-066ASC]KRW75013.1 thiol:disulfide interchange protein [Pseudomonas sp. TTU2014-096BSC]MBA1235649.1 DsbE family thiol:disulfide interchange protein [Stutzerimonas stutzeri]RRV24761.1 DsbE family thiol:disulfide interchange protein [Pseudomonas sp. s199]WAD27909.1 DsbE family thiol:disulfide interchange protein [Pseudomonadaceae bacterium T75]